MITPFMISAFANWAAYQMRTPFARLAFSNAVEKVRQATLILIGNTGTPAFRHVEDMFKMMKAAKTLLIAQAPAVPSEIQLILKEDKDWQIVCDNLRQTKAGLTFMATDPALDRSRTPCRSSRTGPTPAGTSGPRLCAHAGGPGHLPQPPPPT